MAPDEVLLPRTIAELFPIVFLKILDDCLFQGTQHPVAKLVIELNLVHQFRLPRRHSVCIIALSPFFPNGRFFAPRLH